jgi:HK97 family phage prohead protease
MPILKDRQYRALELAIPKKEEKKNKFDSDYYVEGYATTFAPYLLYEYDDRKVYEEFLPECFRDCDMSDVIFQFDHAGKVYARQSNNTLTVEPDNYGLFVCADLSKTTASREMHEEIASGLVTKMSWGFLPDYDSLEIVEQGNKVTIRHHKVKKMFDVSAVSIPANNNTDIQARNFADGVIDEMMKEFQKRKNHIRRIKLLMEVRK